MRTHAYLQFIVLLCCYSLQVAAQNRIDPYDGPVQFIKSVPGVSKGSFQCSGKCTESPVISAVANDRIFVRLAALDLRVHLTVTDDINSKVYLKKADTAARSGHIIRQLIDIKGSMNVMLHGTMDGGFDYSTDEEVNDGLYTMYLRASYPALNMDWPLAKRLSYFLNNFYADGVFLTETKLDSTEDNDTWSLTQGLQKDYFGFASIMNSRKWGRGADREWSCESMYWLSDKGVMTLAAAKKEMNVWATQLAGIQGLKKIKADYSGDGPEVLLYEMTADPELAKFPRRALWSGYDEDNNIAGSPAKLYLIVSAIKKAKEDYMIEVQFARDRDAY